MNTFLKKELVTKLDKTNSKISTFYSESLKYYIVMNRTEFFLSLWKLVLIQKLFSLCPIHVLIVFEETTGGPFHCIRCRIRHTRIPKSFRGVGDAHISIFHAGPWKYIHLSFNILFILKIVDKSVLKNYLFQLTSTSLCKLWNWKFLETVVHQYVILRIGSDGRLVARVVEVVVGESDEKPVCWNPLQWNGDDGFGDGRLIGNPLPNVNDDENLPGTGFGSISSSEFPRVFWSQPRSESNQFCSLKNK